MAELAERLRAVVGDRPFAIGEGRRLAVTVSVGCVSRALDALSVAVAAADEALYDAKRGGRNRVAMHGA